MKRRSLMKEIEQREGKPIREILMETYPLYDNQSGVANALGISQPTLSLWLIRLGLKEKTILVQRDESPMLTVPAAVESLAAYPSESQVVVP